MAVAKNTSLSRKALVLHAFETQAAYVPDMRAELEPAGTDWISAQTFFSDDEAMDEFLAFEQSRYARTDLKTAGAFLINDYAYIFAATTVPLFVGFGLVPELSPASVALSFYTKRQLHHGKIYRSRRAHMRFKEAGIRHGRLDDTADGDLYRIGIENHFYLVVDRVQAKTKLSRAALWRLVGDAIAQRFLDAGLRFDAVEAAKAAAMRILKTPGSPLANRELHYFDVTQCDRQRKAIRETFRQRGGCCRFYLVEGGTCCSTCVLKSPQDRNEELQLAMRQNLSFG